MRARMLMPLLFLLATPGCSLVGGADGPIGSVLQQVDIVNGVRCPELEPADKAALRARTSRPAHWADKGATKGELLAHVDRLELGEARKAAAGGRVIAEHGRCRGTPSPKKPEARVS